MPADMKELIAEAAKRLVVDKNVKKLTVKDIVEECNITRQTFYYHFEDIPHLLEWVLERGLRQMKDDSRGESSTIERFRYFFLLSAQMQPYVKKTLASNYGEELQRLMKKELLNLAEEIADEERLYQNLDSRDRRFVLRYHCQAILGILNDWSEEDTKDMDRIVRAIYKIISGHVPL